MTMREMFGVAMRVVAFVLLAYGLSLLLFACIEAGGGIARSQVSVSAVATFGLFMMVLGGQIFLIADWTAAIAYSSARATARGGFAPKGDVRAAQIKVPGMTAGDLFGLLVRTLAVLTMVYGIYEIFYALAESSGLALHSAYTSSEHLIAGMIRLPLGVAILALADRITALVYPDPAAR